MKRNKLVKLAFLGILTAFGVQSSLACMYGPPYRTVCETYAQADSVIIAKVQSVKLGPPLQFEPRVQTVVLNVVRTFKGQNRRRIVLSQPLSNCDPDFSSEVGETQLFYLVRDKETRSYIAIAEGMGGLLETQSENLYWLNDLPRSRNRTRVSGEIKVGTDQDNFIFIPGIKVKVFNAANSFTVRTDKNGVYQVWDVPAGKYQVEPILPDNMELDLELERGSIDFDTLKSHVPNASRVLVEIQPKGCGGIDFILNEKTAK
jgi:hypothetical protein